MQSATKKREYINQAKALGKSNERVGLVVKLITVALLTALVCGGLFVAKLLKEESRRVRTAVERD